jgi:hypothetical protein
MGNVKSQSCCVNREDMSVFQGSELVTKLHFPMSVGYYERSQHSEFISSSTWPVTLDVAQGTGVDTGNV